MADVTPRNGPLTWLAGASLFVVFETVVYQLLQFATSGLGQANQLQPENTIVSNWVKTVVFLLLHLLVVIGAVLALSNWLPRRYRGHLMSFVLLIPLFA